MYWQSAFLAFLVGAITATAGVHWYRRQHPRFNRISRVRWLQAFDFERAGYTLIALSVVVFLSQYLFPVLGIVAGLLLGARAALAVMQHQRYDPNTTPRRDVHYVD
ncbi:hypothetical protein ACH9L7_19995 (plasmid) [Haloferax sp. S1W]|uniref:hypothetical protein n=1 Tax=Haloferax sp. S1W TaxID=3377110 RepID=UPI0037C7B0C7